MRVLANFMTPGPICRLQVLHDMVGLAVLPQHVPPSCREFFEIGDVVSHGVKHALIRAEERATAASADGGASSKGGPGKWFRKFNIFGGGSDDEAGEEADRMITQSQRHAAMILRVPAEYVEHLLVKPSIQTLLEAAASNKVEDLLKSSKNALKDTRAGPIAPL